MDSRIGGVVALNWVMYVVSLHYTHRPGSPVANDEKCLCHYCNVNNYETFRSHSLQQI